MNKENIKKALKAYGYTMITKSWFTGDDNTSVIFNAYDEYGNCHHFFIDNLSECATKQSLSAITVHESRDVSWIFFKNAKIA